MRSKGQLCCDVCEKKEGFHGFSLLTCKTCGVSVHHSCYGLSAHRTEHLEWECHACAAVSNNNALTRPTECALCSVNDGIHAMHPLYDTHGRRGKQIGWVHTLCALFVGANNITRGSVYGCDKNGIYEGDDADVELSSEKEFEEEEQPHKDGDEGPEVSETHHFCICRTDDRSVWANVIKESRSLKCVFCGKRDKYSLRVPVQCEAGGKEEPPQLKARRKRTKSNTCYSAMHVGCARWKGNKPYQRVFFFPGTVEGDGEEQKIIEPKCCCYCEKHSKDIFDHDPKANSHADITSKSKIQEQKEQSNKPEKQPIITQLKSFNLEGNKQTGIKRRLSDSQTNEVKRMKLLQETGTNSLAPSTKPLPSANILFNKVLDDVLLKLRKAIPGKEIVATREAKDHWKKESNLSSSDFKELWSKVRNAVESKAKIKDLHRPISGIDLIQQTSFNYPAIPIPPRISKVRSSSFSSYESKPVKQFKRSRSDTIISNPSLKKENVIEELKDTFRVKNDSSIPFIGVKQGATMTKKIPSVRNPWACLFLPNYDRDSELMKSIL